MKIERSLNGTPLFETQEQSGPLCSGDAILLLWDIEQAIELPGDIRQASENQA